MANNWSVDKLQNIHKPLPIAKHVFIHANDSALPVSDAPALDEHTTQPLELSDISLVKAGPFRVKFDDKKLHPSYKDWHYDHPVNEYVETETETDADPETDTDDSYSSEDSVLAEAVKTVAATYVDASPTKRKEFWDRKPAYTVGFNSARVVQAVNPNAKIGARGRPLTHPKDKVQCQVCGGIYARCGVTNHKKTQKHIKAANVNEKLVEAMLTLRKRKYYFKEEDAI